MLDKVYLAKIGLGMAGVFGVGMVVASAVDAGKSKVHEIAHTDASITVPLFGIPFRTAKGDLGAMQKLQVERSAPEMIEAFNLTVKLNDGQSASQFADCEITIAGAAQLENIEDTRFTCLTAADPGFEELVNFGTIRFEPSGQVHRLMVPASVRDEIRHADGGSGVAEASAVETQSTDGGLSIKINGKSIVDIHGDSAGGVVRINDPETGKSIVDISSGAEGAAVSVDAPPAPKAPAKSGTP